MISLPDLRYHYQQAVESVVIQKSTRVITSVAFHAFHTAKRVALFPTAIFGFAVGTPMAIASIPFFLIAYGIDFAARKFCRVENPPVLPASRLQQVILIIDSIIKYMRPKMVYFFTIVAFAPFIAVTIVIDYTEDKAIEITQIALDTLGIPVELQISRRKLLIILREWESLAHPEENRKKASKRIIDYYERSNELFRDLFPFHNYLYIGECGLHSLPEIFQYKPFSNLNALSLINNRLTYLPNALYSLPSDCQLFISQNEFSEEEVFRILRTTNQPNYHGPVINGITIHDAPDFFVEAQFVLDGPGEPHDTTQQEENQVPRIVNQLYRNLYQAIGREPQDLSNLEHSETLRSWLSRLSRVSDYSRANANTRRAFITNIITYLEEANRNPEFQNIFNQIIYDASATCGDRVALSVLHLDIAYQLENIDLSNMRELSQFLLRGCLAMELLEECARQKVQSMLSEVDELEVYLGYPIALKQELNLPISQETMLYFRCSLLTREDLAIANDFVMSHLNDHDACLTFLIRHDTWKRALVGYNQGAMDTIERKKLRDLENAESPEESLSIENEYIQALKALSAQAIR